MTWVAFLLLAAMAVSPVLLTLRRAGSGRARQPAAVALYRAQLGELDRDLADRRIAASEHAAAALEVQRRLLAAAAIVDPAAAAPGRREPLVLTMVMVVTTAIGLYALEGRPDLPARATDARTLNAALPGAGPLAESTDDDREQLRRMIDDVDAVADATRQEQIEQGDSAERHGDAAAAAAAWRQALAIRFDPVLAVRTADAESKADGRIGFGAAALFRRALAAVPAGTPWRTLVERRLVEAERP